MAQESMASTLSSWDKEDPYFRPRGSMASLVSSSPSSDLSLSVGYFPHDDELSYEDSGSDTSLPYLVPPIQSKWKIENLGRQRGRRQQGEDSPKPFCRQAQNDGSSSERKDTVAMTSCNLYRDAGWGDRKLLGKKQLKLRQMNSLVQKLQTFLENQKSDESTDEDGQAPGSPVPDLAEQAATKHHVPEQGEAIQFMEEDTTLQGHDLVGRGCPEADGTALWPGHSENEAPARNIHSHSCFNFRTAIRWLRQHVLSSQWGRGHANRGPPKRSLRSCMRVQPQESLELGTLRT